MKPLKRCQCNTEDMVHGIVAYLLPGGPIGKEMILLHCHDCYNERITTVCCPLEAMDHNWSQWETMGVQVLNTLDWDKQGISKVENRLWRGSTRV